MAEPSHFNDESTKVLGEYLELFHCLGYRYKYYLAPNAVLQWFGTRHIRGAIGIHEFLLRNFQCSFQHANFEKATSCAPIEKNECQLQTKNMPTHSNDLIHPKNKIRGINSLKSRAESDIESDTEMSVDTVPNEIERILPTTSKVIEQQEPNYESDDSEDYSTQSSKRVKYSTPPSTPFKYLRRLPTKNQHKGETSDDDSSDDDEVQKKSQLITSCDYTPLRYLEAFGKILEKQAEHMGGGYKEQPIRLRISYRRNLKNQTIQFALIIYEFQEEKLRSRRKIRMPDFSKSFEVDLSLTEDPLESMETAQPAVILSNRDGEEHETIATVTTPSSAEIATALEEAAFTIQPPIQRTPTKTTPIPPSTPKRRPRSVIVMSGVAPLSLSSMKKLNRPPCRAPKISAARSLRL